MSDLENIETTTDDESNFVLLSDIVNIEKVTEPNVSELLDSLDSIAENVNDPQELSPQNNISVTSNVNYNSDAQESSSAIAIVKPGYTENKVSNTSDNIASDLPSNVKSEHNHTLETSALHAKPKRGRKPKKTANSLVVKPPLEPNINDFLSQPDLVPDNAGLNFNNKPQTQSFKVDTTKKRSGRKPKILSNILLTSKDCIKPSNNDSINSKIGTEEGLVIPPTVETIKIQRRRKPKILKDFVVIPEKSTHFYDTPSDNWSKVENTNTHKQELTDISPATGNTKKKRGRKPKVRDDFNSPNDESTTHLNVTPSNDFSKVEDPNTHRQDLTDVSPASGNIKKRRGRKPKVRDDFDNLNDVPSTHLNEIASDDFSKVGNPNVHRQDLTDISPTTGKNMKKRGRKPKVKDDFDVPNNISSTHLYDTPSDDCSKVENLNAHRQDLTDITPTSGNIKRRRDSKPKVKDDSTSPNDDSAEFPLPKRRKQDKYVESFEIEYTPNIVKKKVGRKSWKVSTGNGQLDEYEPSKLDKETPIVPAHLSDDEDNLVLSSLKDKSLDQTDASNATTILSEFEYNAKNVITKTNNVIVESMCEINEELPTDINIEKKIIEGEPTTDNEFKLPENNELNTETSVVQTVGLENNEQDTANQLLVEDNTKRPTRRKASKPIHYDTDSDEDPFANVELSDDNNQSDDEYIPDDYIPNKPEKLSTEEEYESGIDDLEEDNPRKKRGRKKSDTSSLTKSPRKKVRHQKHVISSDSLNPTKSAEVGKDTPTPEKTSDSKNTKSHSFGVTGNREFEKFLAQTRKAPGLEIKKVSESTTSLTIPVIDAVELKKPIEVGTQTNEVKVKSMDVQTTTPYSLKIVKSIDLSTEQSSNACEFLGSILKSTSELGSLMMQKSDEFINKKINSANVTNTFKIDYCIKKAFLLLKLAKDNLNCMEENLEKQYEDFMKNNNLSEALESEKKIAPKPVDNDDSDCEIVDVQETTKQKPKFNPKTVFLNKELSIKIAKKPSTPIKNVTTKRSIDIKGKSKVWISNSVMVKKISKPAVVNKNKNTQSFLAQDSRNKKPPDNFVTAGMVKNFFDDYYKAEVQRICAPFTETSWLNIRINSLVTCNYFLVSEEKTTAGCSETPTMLNRTIPENDYTENSLVDFKAKSKHESHKVPKSLITLCTELLQNCNSQSSTEDAFCNEEILPIEAEIKHTSLNPKTLITLCIDLLQNCIAKINVATEIEIKPVESLFRICSGKVINMFKHHDRDILEDMKYFQPITLHKRCIQIINQYLNFDVSKHKWLSSQKSPLLLSYTEDVNSLMESSKKTFSLSAAYSEDIATSEFYTCKPSTLKRLAYYAIKSLVFQDTETTEHIVKFSEFPSLNKICLQKLVKYMCFSNIELPVNSLMIDNINTLSEEAFFNLDEDSNASQDNHFEENFSDTEVSLQNTIEEEAADNWAAQIQMEEIKPIFLPGSMLPEYNKDDRNIKNVESMETAMVHIKQEIIDEQQSENLQINIKTEPDDVETDIFNGAENPIVTTKKEFADARAPRDLNMFSEDNFESFAAANMFCNGEFDKIFTQSLSRIRRQHEPDSDDENFNDTSLLIPQNAEMAKDSLMHSSSEDNSNRKNVSDNKEKKKRGRKKKNEKIVDKPAEDSTGKSDKLSIPVLKPVPNEINILTRKMKGKMRTEEKKIDSSDSETENIEKFNTKRKKMLTPQNLEQENSLKEKRATRKNQAVEEEIQCNNVDSTECIGDTEEEVLRGFSAKERNDLSSHLLSDFEVLANKASDQKALTETVGQCPSPTFTNPDLSGGSYSPINMSDELVEQLECEPTLPIFQDESPKKENKNIGKVVEKSDSCTDSSDWKCYPIDGKDAKLYQFPYVPLDKLPEIFVQTYLKFLEMNEKKREDSEVDKLTNLHSLHRASLNKDGTTTRTKSETKSKEKLNIVKSDSEATDSALSDNGEFEPSDDENVARLEDAVAPALPLPQTDNGLAKNSLMDDSDGEKEDNKDGEKEDNKDSKELKKAIQLCSQPPPRKSKPCPLSKKVKVYSNAKDLVLTADKMMKSELALLHAPVNMEPEKKPVTEQKHAPEKEGKSKRPKRNQSKREQTKSGDDSSSEEEKLWVNTKEKLLKRIEKRTQDTGIDDAKKTKLVNEFLERRIDHAPKKIINKSRRGRLSLKKRLERQKQLKVLTKEMLGEAPTHKTSSSAYSKGRRNIRKVIDKKSLARSTVIANMEEFERKKRLNLKQNKLREVLDYEEDVNVLVINDEVCLEYDFQLLQPVVSVHPFFTKVMKAHQYEGVKFMWDACFESLEMVESGHSGGGCILAHCMGLGKTLQVLALLHTVLTHPRVGMQRVLVCCPLSTVLNWVDEIHKWLGPVTSKIKVFELSKLKKAYERAHQLEDWYNDGGIFIIGYELFRNLTTLDPELDDIRPTIINKIKNALLDPGPDIVICDEGHLLKNDSSVLAMAMSRVKTLRRIILTGTPMQNNLREYYCMVNFVKPNLLGTYSEYSNRFENPIMNGQHRDSREEDIKLMKTRTHILHKVLEGCLQRQEASVLYPYLPKKYEYTVFITLTPVQAEMYKHYLSQCSKNVANQKHSILKDYNILQKVWSHPLVLHNFQVRKRDEKIIKDERLEDDLAREDLTATEDSKPSSTDTWWLEYLDGGNMLDSLDSSNKFVIVFKILSECIAMDDKLLIFSTSLYTMDALEYFLKKINNWSLGQEYYRLDGSVPPEVRQKWCREFNAENNIKTKLFLISTRAGSLGLNMTSANRVIIMDTSWNPAHDIQSIFRVYRFGQKKDCYIYRLVAMGTMEQKIYERSVTKQAVSCRVVDEQQIDRHYNMAELAELYQFDLLGAGVECGVAAGVRDVALLRVARDTAALHAVHEHDSLLRDTRDALSQHERDAAWTQFQREQRDKEIKSLAIYQPHLQKKTVKKELPEIPLDDKTMVKIEDSSLIPPAKPTKGKKGRKAKHHKKPVTVAKNDQPETQILPETLVPEPTAPSSSVPELSAPSTSITEPSAPIVTAPLTIIPDANITDPHTKSILSRITEALQEQKYKNINPEEVTKLITNLLSLQNIQLNELPEASTVSKVTQKSQPLRGTPMTVTCVGAKSQNEVPANTETSNSQVNAAEGRARRRAARNAQKQISNWKNDTAIDLQEDNNRKHSEEDNDYVPSGPESYDDNSQSSITSETATKKNKPSPKKAKNKLKENKKSKNIENDTIKKVVDSQVSEPNKVPNISTSTLDDSIVLSDDDTPVETTVSVNVKTEEEVLPLHTSLLKNSNFVKIVAYSYLKRNSSLDDAAATVAAEYSISKALKEVEETGKQITNGPIYDIAVQVLGKGVLRKLTESESKKARKNDVKNILHDEATSSKGNVQAPVPISLVAADANSLKPNVVPVGLIRRYDEMPQTQFPGPSGGECILPDDDDLYIVDVSPPAQGNNTNNSIIIPEETIVPQTFVPNSVIIPPIAPAKPIEPFAKTILKPGPKSSQISSNEAIVPTLEPKTRMPKKRRISAALKAVLNSQPSSAKETATTSQKAPCIATTEKKSANTPQKKQAPTTLNKQLQSQPQIQPWYALKRVGVDNNSGKPTTKNNLPKATEVQPLPNTVNTTTSRRQSRSTASDNVTATNAPMATISLDSDDEEPVTNTQPNLQPVQILSDNSPPVVIKLDGNQIVKDTPQIFTFNSEGQLVSSENVPNLQNYSFVQSSAPVSLTIDDTFNSQITPVIRINSKNQPSQPAFIKNAPKETTIDLVNPVPSSRNCRVVLPNTPPPPAPSLQKTPKLPPAKRSVVQSTPPVNLIPKKPKLSEKKQLEQKKVTPNLEAEKNRRISLSSSGSERSRSPSPHNPLDILKNVVHIQAPSQEVARPTASTSTSKNNTVTKKSSECTTNITNVGVRKTPQKIPSRDKSSSHAVSVKISKEPPRSTSKATPSHSSSKNVKNDGRIDTIDLSASHSAPKNDKKFRNLTKIDLSDTNNPRTKTLAEILSKAKLVKVATKAEAQELLKGKAAIFSHVAKTLSPRPKQSDTKAKEIRNLPQSSKMNTTAIDAKRKSTSIATPETKRQKHDKKPTRLEDFSIDDIEDIIELE